MEEVINGILIREVETKNIMTKSSLPVGGYSVNPYVGCTHACKYCYASFMKRFTGHKEEWGTFLDVKHWPEIKNPKKYAGQRVVIGSVTDGYNPQEEQFGNTRKLLEQLIGSDADILICTKSDLVVRDIDLLKKLGRVTVSWSINTLDENFKNDMDSASSIEHRIAAMKQVYEAGIRTVCFVSPVFPGITDFELSVAHFALRIFLGAVGEDGDLLRFAVFENFGGNFSTLDNGSADHSTILFADCHNAVELNGGVSLGIQFFDVKNIAFADTILFSTGFNNSVHQ